MEEKERITAHFLGSMPYAEALELQKNLQKARESELIDDTLLFLEHPPVYTMGKRAQKEDFLIPPQELEYQGYEIHVATRGGQITYHGPGQLVVYFIINLYQAHRELREFVGAIEQALCSYLKDVWNMDAHIDEEHPGAWVGDEKIAALGIAINHKVTMHGIALNVSTDLKEFQNIVPCGISDKGVCSILSLTGQSPDLMQVAQGFGEYIRRELSYKTIQWMDLPVSQNPAKD